MKFNLVSENNGNFSVVFADFKSDKRLVITGLELEEPALLSREAVISEIKERTREHFSCDEVKLKMDIETEKAISKTFLHNKFVFEAE